MSADEANKIERPKIAKVLFILGVIAPLTCIGIFALVAFFPAVFLGQRSETMIGWGWVTLPLAILAGPTAAIIISYRMLKRFTQHAAEYLVAAVLVYFVLAKILFEVLTHLE